MCSPPRRPDFFTFLIELDTATPSIYAASRFGISTGPGGGGVAADDDDDDTTDDDDDDDDTTDDVRRCME